MTKRTTSIITLLTMALLLVPGAALLPQADAMGHENTCPAVPNPNADLQLDGAGASFSFPLIDLWRVEYGKEFPNVQLNYQSIGSGGGVKNHIAKTIVFAGSDAPLKPAEREAAPNTLHIPEAIGGVTVAYNIPEVPESGLKLTGTVIADIFLGKITKFNDPAIQDLNPEISLPDKDIVVAHRSDGSGTTFVFTSYLNQVSAEWDEKVGAGKSVEWPAGIGGKGNEGVANVVKTTPYSIGYIELAYAFQNNIPYAHVMNADGTSYVKPSMKTIAAASAGAAPTLPAAHESWYGVSLLNAPGYDSYPIATFTYLLLYENLNEVTDDPATAQALMHMIHWIITKGQNYNDDLLYVPIAPEVMKIGIDGLKRVQFDGEPAWTASGIGSGPAPAAAAQTASSESSEGGGCLIATAAFGSEMAPQVQFLREIRDGKVMATQSGTAFMTGFNQFYYSFSPAVADYERENPVFKETVKLALTPMLTSLTLLNHVSVDTEEQMLGWGISLILLNIGMYFVAPAVIIAKIKKRLRN
jgi:phosphate transport system substrate-binding protein